MYLIGEVAAEHPQAGGIHIPLPAAAPRCWTCEGKSMKPFLKIPIYYSIDRSTPIPAQYVNVIDTPFTRTSGPRTTTCSRRSRRTSALCGGKGWGPDRARSWHRSKQDRGGMGLLQVFLSKIKPFCIGSPPRKLTNKRMFDNLLA